MPITVTIRERKVSITDDCQAVLDIFKATISNNSDSMKTFDISEPRLENDGIMNRAIHMVEGGLQRRFGATASQIGELSVDMDFFGEVIYKFYLHNTRELLHKSGLTAEQCVSDTIEDPNVLIKEIWMRFIASALSIKQPEDKINETLTRAKNFIAELKDKKVLNTNVAFGDLETDLSIVETICRGSTIIHSNKHAVQDVRNFTKSARLMINRQILAFTDSSCNVACYQEEDIEFWIRKMEERVLGKESSDDSSRSKRIVSLFSKDKNFKEISERYSLLDELNGLDAILNRVDALMDMLGWVPIVMGLLKFDKFMEKIQETKEECMRILDIKEHPIMKVKGNPKDALYAKQANEASPLGSLAQKCIIKLKEISNPALLEDIVQVLRVHFADLINIQKQTKIEVLDEDCLLKIQGMFSPQTLLQKEGERRNSQVSSMALEGAETKPALSLALQAASNHEQTINFILSLDWQSPEFREKELTRFVIQKIQGYIKTILPRIKTDRARLNREKILCDFADAIIKDKQDKYERSTNLMVVNIVSDKEIIESDKTESRDDFLKKFKEATKILSVEENERINFLRVDNTHLFRGKDFTREVFERLRKYVEERLSGNIKKDSNYSPPPYQTSSPESTI